MIWAFFVGGFVLGGVFGVLLACILFARKDDEK